MGTKNSRLWTIITLLQLSHDFFHFVRWFFFFFFFFLLLWIFLFLLAYVFGFVFSSFFFFAFCLFSGTSHSCLFFGFVFGFVCPFFLISIFFFYLFFKVNLYKPHFLSSYFSSQPNTMRENLIFYVLLLFHPLTKRTLNV